MTRTTRTALKTVAWIAALGPLATIGWRAVEGTLGADPAARIASITGLAAAWLLAVTLAITPLRRFVPALVWLIHFRRLAGLFAFFYATLHLFTYVALYSGFDVATMIDDVTKRRFILAGVATWLVLLPLAATSTQWAIRKLGGRRWNLLHKLTYLAAVSAVLHYWWKVKPGVLSPAPFTLVIGLLLAARLLLLMRRRTA